MDHFKPLDWIRILVGEAPLLFYGELVLRILMLFALLLIVVRLLGKREQDSLSPMQQMLLIALGAAAGDVMLYPEVAIGHVVVVLFGMTLLTIITEKIAARSRPVRDYLESHPRVLIHNGKVDHDALRHERTSARELAANLRVHGAVALSQVEMAVLEVTGEISVVLNDSKPTKKDLLDYLVNEGEANPVEAAGD